MTLILLIIAAILIYYFLLYKPSGSGMFGFTPKKVCPNCHNPIEDSYNVCPICKETLKRKCPNCNERIDVKWKYCPYCEKPVDNNGGL